MGDDVESYLFNVIEKTRDILKVSYCANLADLSDNFISYQELIALADGELKEYQFKYDIRDGKEYEVIFYEDLDRALENWIGLMGPRQINTTKKTPEIEEALENHKNYTIHNRLFRLNKRLNTEYRIYGKNKNLRNEANVTKDATRVSRADRLLQRDVRNIVNICENTINDVYGTTLEFSKYLNEAQSYVELAKGCVGWRQMKSRETKNYWRRHPRTVSALPAQDQPWIKVIWDDPSEIKRLLRK